MSQKYEILTPKMIENLLISYKIKKIKNGRNYYTNETLTFIKQNIKNLSKEDFLNYLNVSIEDFGSKRLRGTLNSYRKKLLYHPSKTITSNPSL